MHLWSRKSLILGFALAVTARWVAPQAATATTPWEEHGKLQVSANGRHLEHIDGTPMLWIADTGWESYLPYGPWDRVMALSMHLYTLMTQVADAPEDIVYGTAVVLIGLVLAVNSVSIALRVFLRSRKKW